MNTRFIGIASGKGGTGKTTTAINLSLALHNLGYETTLIDANLATPHVALHLGSPNLPITVNDVLRGERQLYEAMYRHSSGLKVVPSSISVSDIDESNPEKLSNLLYGQEMGDFVVLDMSSGLTSDVRPILSLLTDILVVTNPDIPSVIEAAKLINMAQQDNINVQGLVLNKAGKESTLDKESVKSLTDTDIIAEIPHHKHFSHALSKNQPVLDLKPNSPAAKPFRTLASTLAGPNFTSKSPAEKRLHFWSGGKFHI